MFNFSTLPEIFKKFIEINLLKLIKSIRDAKHLFKKDLRKLSFWIFIFSPLLTSFQLLANPWGKDAELAARIFSHKSFQSPQFPPQSPSLLARMGKTAIRFHQEIISPADGPRSHFIPSSSQYTLDAMQKYGFFQGYLMGCDRLMRENDDPWVYRKVLNSASHLMKWDPIK